MSTDATDPDTDADDGSTDAETECERDPETLAEWADSDLPGAAIAAAVLEADDAE